MPYNPIGICSVEGCGRAGTATGLCCSHNDRRSRTGVVGGPIRPKRAKGAGHVRPTGQVVLEVAGRKRLQHVVIAEAALGKPLPAGAEVHHIDEDPSNNEPTNLVICPDAAYHKLLHQRQRAFDVCGHYGWRKCTFCKKYDAPENVHGTRKQAHHPECQRAHRRVRYQLSKGTHV